MSFKRATWIRATLLLLVTYLLILLATAPATLLGKLMPKGILLTQLSGSLWQGSAAKIAFSSPLGWIQVHDVSWDVQWAYLLRGELALRLESADAAGDVIVARSLNDLRIVQADITLPAADLAVMIPQLALWQPEGEVQFQTQGFALAASTSSMATLSWHNAALKLSAQQTLGDYQLQLRSVQQQVQAQLATLQGELQLEGKGGYSSQNGLQFQGTAQAEPSHATELKALLDSLGRDRGDGVRQISIGQP